METINDITLEKVQDLFDSVIFLRGEEYFEEGYVKSIEAVDSNTLTGLVEGNNTYSVSISIGASGDIICDCSCPCDFNCKHSAALLLKWLSVKNRQSNELKQGSDSTKQSLKQLLNSRSKEELIELLDASIHQYPELRPLIKMERKELISKIRGLFSKFWEWDEVDGLISQLEIILDGIRRNKTSWNKELVKEMETCSAVMIRGIEQVHGEEELSTFLEDWFLTFGEIFSSTKPAKEEKKVFIQKIVDLVKQDDYGYETSYEKALIGMCTDTGDISLVKNALPDLFSEEKSRKEFLLEIYDRLGIQDKYLKTAKETGNVLAVVEKLISLNKLDEALEACKNSKTGDLNWPTIENKKIDLLKKLGRKDEANNELLTLIKKTGEITYAVKLKAECGPKDWERYVNIIIKDARNKKRNNLLSRLYYGENDFKRAYEFSKDVSDAGYIELLAKKLSAGYPALACDLFKKLCAYYINAGSGWPYKKAGKMLEAIKIINKRGAYYIEAKANIIAQHKKKYSLMAIVEKV